VIYYLFLALFQPLDGWSYNTLERLTVVGQRTYERARTRIVDWPTPKPSRPPCQVNNNTNMNIYVQQCKKFGFETTRLVGLPDWNIH
jgi:hypothetical protein